MTAKRFNRVGGYVYDGEKCISHFEDVTHRDDIVTLLNELHEENERLKQAYTQLKHRHSLLHDVCIDAECDRDRYRKDIASLEEENEQLKEENKEIKKRDDLVSSELRDEGSITLEKYDEIVDYLYKEWKKKRDLND